MYHILKGMMKTLRSLNRSGSGFNKLPITLVNIKSCVGEIYCR